MGQDQRLYDTWVKGPIIVAWCCVRPLSSLDCVMSLSDMAPMNSRMSKFSWTQPRINAYSVIWLNKNTDLKVLESEQLLYRRVWSVKLRGHRRRFEGEKGK